MIFPLQQDIIFGFFSSFCRFLFIFVSVELVFLYIESRILIFYAVAYLKRLWELKDSLHFSRKGILIYCLGDQRYVCCILHNAWLYGFGKPVRNYNNNLWEILDWIIWELKWKKKCAWSELHKKIKWWKKYQDVYCIEFIDTSVFSRGTFTDLQTSDFHGTFATSKDIFIKLLFSNIFQKH